MKRITGWLASLLLLVGAISAASATVLSDTVFGVGPIQDVDVSPKVSGVFDLGGPLASIGQITLTLDACDTAGPNCSRTLGAQEFYEFDLGPDSFQIGIGNSNGSQGAVVQLILAPSAALIQDLLDDGRVDFAVGAQNLPAQAFDALIDFADITLAVSQAAVSEPAALALFGIGIAGMGFARRRRRS